MLMIDTILYAILVWYIEAVYPGSYGLPRPWYFPFQASYWFGHNTRACPKFARNYMMVHEDDAPLASPGGTTCEKDPQNLPLGVVIDGLVKVEYTHIIYFIVSVVFKLRRRPSLCSVLFNCRLILYMSVYLL